MRSGVAFRLALAALVPVLTAAVATRDIGRPPSLVVARAVDPPVVSTTAPASPGSARTTPLPAPAPSQARLDRINIRWQQVATAEYPSTVAFRAAATRMYVGERNGRVRLVQDGKALDPPALDITDEVGVEGEGGLLGIVFSRDGSTLYVHYTDKRADSHVVAFAMAGDNADRSARRELLFLDQPEEVHNGGGMVVDERGLLWVGFGDGGERNDKRRVAQDLNSLFGKLIRIDPRPDGNRPYRIPDGNPFAGQRDKRAEIWAYGLRNPWRFSIDRATGDVWIGDVGEFRAEEIDYMPATAAGFNFGWPAFEGNGVFTKSEAAPGHVRPLKVVGHTGDVCAITGGYVYRGKAIPDLVGTYVYTDVCSGVISLLSQENGKVVAERKLGKLRDQLVSFAEDPDGELYVMSLVGPVWKLVPV